MSRLEKFECPECGMRVDISSVLKKSGQNGEETFHISVKCVQCGKKITGKVIEYQG